MPDESYLDQKYFIDDSIYNCPYCNRRHVAYVVVDIVGFNWSTEKYCTAWFVQCRSCKGTSMHLTFNDLQTSNYSSPAHLTGCVDLDSQFFYSVPTSFFVVDARIPKIIRELITEAEGCVKMNYLTGASACCRKAIYELTVKEEAEGQDYEARIKFLKDKFPSVDSELFDILCHIKDMTSDKIHEQSWDKWDAKHLTMFLETLKAILHDIYVVPDEKKSRSQIVRDLLQKVRIKQKQAKGNGEAKATNDNTENKDE